jgi:hypothetical protein
MVRTSCTAIIIARRFDKHVEVRQNEEVRHHGGLEVLLLVELRVVPVGDQEVLLLVELRVVLRVVTRKKNTKESQDVIFIFI